MLAQGIAGIAVSQRRGNILTYKECFATPVSDGSDFSEYFVCKNLNILYLVSLGAKATIKFYSTFRLTQKQP